MRRVKEVATNFLSDQLHAEQDRKLALTIFDQTKELHSLVAEERYWLECATILHDVGMSKGRKGHQKQSLKIILNNPDLPFTQKERYIIGSIARYHRKALPDDSHYNLTSLTKVERKKVTVLSSILRLADALDYSHGSVVRKVNVRAFPHHIILECSISGRNDSEYQAVRKEKELFQSVFQRDLLVVCKPQDVVGERHLPAIAQSVNRRSVESMA
jgi:exopolyphosphatase/guanosine-5'-triphosphate,3'-diphosphate pyrophosphatase